MTYEMPNSLSLDTWTSWTFIYLICFAIIPSLMAFWNIDLFQIQISSLVKYHRNKNKKEFT